MRISYHNFETGFPWWCIWCFKIFSGKCLFVCELTLCTLMMSWDQPLMTSLPGSCLHHKSHALAIRLVYCDQQDITWHVPPVRSWDSCFDLYIMSGITYTLKAASHGLFHDDSFGFSHCYHSDLWPNLYSAESDRWYSLFGLKLIRTPNCLHLDKLFNSWL